MIPLKLVLNPFPLSFCPYSLFTQLHFPPKFFSLERLGTLATEVTAGLTAIEVFFLPERLLSFKLNKQIQECREL